MWPIPFLSKLINIFYRGKSSPNFGIFHKNCPNKKNRLIGENSFDLVTLILFKALFENQNKIPLHSAPLHAPHAAPSF
jgi:hypothetical protein